MLTLPENSQTTDDQSDDSLPDVRVEVVTGRAARRQPSSRLTKLRNRLRGGRPAQRAEFAQIMEAAQQDRLSLPSLINLFGRAAQARAFTEVLRYAQDRGDCNYGPEDVLFSPYESLTPDGRTFADLRREVGAPRLLRLGVDIRCRRRHPPRPVFHCARTLPMAVYPRASSGVRRDQCLSRSIAHECVWQLSPA